MSITPDPDPDPEPESDPDPGDVSPWGSARFGSELKAAAVARANDLGMNFSEYMRELARSDIEQSDRDLP